MTTRALLFVPALALAASTARAEPTLELRLGGPREILPGDPVSTSVDADGVITMGPRLVPLGEFGGRPVTAMLVEAKATLVAAKGAIYSVSGGAPPKLLVEDDKRVFTALVRHQGALYVAAAPEGTVYELAGATLKPVVRTETKYVWDLLSDGPRLLLATGEPGKVLAMTAPGKLTTLLDGGETHLRALAKHPSLGIVVGGGQKGIVYRLGAKAGEHFALYDSTLEEVTALEIDPKSGAIYAALVSETAAGALLPDKSMGPVATDSKEPSSPVKGSEVVRIGKDGEAEMVWSSRREGALALAFDAARARLFVATGGGAKDRGRVYEVATDAIDRLSLWARLEAPVISALSLGSAGLFAGTAPVGGLVQIGPVVASPSVYVSSEQDLARPASIGRVWSEADRPAGAKVAMEIRTGNTKEVDATWSAWSAAVDDPDGGAVSVPVGRYVQLRATLTAGEGGRRPAVKSLHASLLRANGPPQVREVSLLERGVQMRALPKDEEREKTLTLSENALQRLRPGTPPERTEPRVKQGWSDGFLTVVWRAVDRNGDELLYRVELRSAGATPGPWLELGRDLPLTFHSFDSRVYADGRYQIRVRADDRPNNPPNLVLSHELTSEPFWIDNQPPTLRGLTAKRSGAVQVLIEAIAEDDTTILGVADVSIDGGPWLMLPAADGFLDQKVEKLAVVAALGPAPVHTVTVRVTDGAQNVAKATVAVP